MTTKPLTDDSLMYFGKYEDKKMGEIPARYLLWLYHERKIDHRIKKYIQENLDDLKKCEKRGC